MILMMMMLSRKWRILVSHIKCSSLLNPPTGCLQYLWGKQFKFELEYQIALNICGILKHSVEIASIPGELGSVKSFNYDTSGTYEHLQAQDYQICIR